MSKHKPRFKKKFGYYFRWFLVILAVYLVAEYLLLPDVSSLKTYNPESTAIMRQRRWEALWHFRTLKISHRWVAFPKISSNLKHAVLVGEDGVFYSHHGFDYEEIQEAIKSDIKHKRFVRGASTISMQLAKNLYLSTSKSPLRKLKEVIITIRLERELPKRRILEIYLNSIEWGNGIFGCEAASRYYFGKSCSSLSPYESAMLAATIPNPRYDNPRTNTRQFQYRTRLIYSRM